MEFRILGQLDVAQDRQSVPIGGRGEQALLAIFLLHPNELLAIDRLVDELWGEAPPASARSVVYNRVSRLRKAIGAGRITTESGGYRLRVDASELDSTRFEMLVRSAATLPVTERVATLRRALALWRDVPLPEFSFETFCRVEIATLEKARLRAIEDRVDADLALGNHDEVIAELEALCARHPYSERLRGALILALHRSGRTGEAVRQYCGIKDALGELNVQPGTRLTDLYREISSSEPGVGGVPVERVVELLPTSDRERGEMLYRLAVPLAWTGEAARSNDLLHRAHSLAVAAHDRALEAKVCVEVALGDVFAGRVELAEAIVKIDASIRVLQQEADDAGLAAAFHRWSSLAREAGRAHEALRAAEQALFHSRRTRDHWLALPIAGATARALAYGTTPAALALERCRALPPEYADTFGVAAGTSILLAELGRFGEARETGRRCRELTGRVGATGPLASFRFYAGWVELLAGDLENAERELREGSELFRLLGADGLRSWLEAELALVLALSGRAADAIDLAAKVREARSGGDPMPRLFTLQAMVYACVELARFKDAAEAADEAVEIAQQTDWLSFQGDAAMTRARVAVASQRPERARSEARRALRIYRQRGNTVGGRGAAGLLATLD